MTNPKQASYDAKRSTTLFRIERALLSLIQRFAAKNGTTAKDAIDSVLRTAFKVKPLATLTPPTPKHSTATQARKRSTKGRP